MKKLKHVKIDHRRETFRKSLQKIEKKTNELVDQHNQTMTEIRLIKKKLRVNAHFGRS